MQKAHLITCIINLQGHSQARKSGRTTLHLVFSQFCSFTLRDPAGWCIVAAPITAERFKSSQGSRPIRDSGNVAHMNGGLWVAPAGVVLIMIWRSCWLLTRSIPVRRRRSTPSYGCEAFGLTLGFSKISATLRPHEGKKQLKAAVVHHSFS